MLESKATTFCDWYYPFPSYPKTNSWNKTVDCCSWDGLTCDSATGNVIGLDLTCSWLYGTLQSNSSLFLLHHLRSLNLSGNNFAGSHISPNLSAFATLTHLNLSHSNLLGTIPSEISRLSKLVSLDLSYNSFSSLRLESSVFEIFVQNLTTLRKVVLHRLDMSMVSPKSFANLSSSLTYLGVDSCSLGGIFPNTVFRLSSLKTLNMNYNDNLVGILPGSNWTNPLESLSLQGTIFSGEIPESIGYMKNLTVLDLSYCIFTRHIPSSMKNLNQLQVFSILGNNFSGVVDHDTLEILDLSDNLPEGGIQHSLQILDLSNNNLSGNMPSCFGNITNLHVLDLSSNKLQGRLSRSLVKCVNLSALILGHNEFSDIFPDWLEAPQLYNLNLQSNKFYGRINLTAFRLSFPILQSLSISNNNFTGRWPRKFFSNTSLVVIDLSNNKFGGPIPLPSPITFYYAIASNKITGKVPSMICNFAKLEIIDLSNNSLTSSLPRCLANFSTILSVLNLRMNYLEGTIPQSFSFRSRLMTLDLSQNQFDGTLPRSLVKCRYLEVLDLGDNQIEDTFPRWLGTLQELKVLVLRSNNLKGLWDIPKGAHLFPKLHILDFSNNNFSGALPADLIMNLRSMMNGENGQDKSLYMTRHLGQRSIQPKLYENSVIVMMKGLETELVKILTFLTIIDLSHNSFQGHIPEVIGHLHSLIGLNLSHNHLTDSIPMTLGNLTNLGWLDLSSNKLGGAIPRELGDLASLGYLNLSKNQLIGRIPQDKQLSTFSSNSFCGNPGLCGTPLLEACPGDAQTPPPSSSSSFDRKGQESWFKHKTIWIGYASGIAQMAHARHENARENSSRVDREGKR
ncbi:hypothetical protein EUGRSUZ_F00702 [Eucalyptus grandis]|uniref:Uncharacterized protein n=2 Tax=Eucalyptus grandis TaxID=71139 RepID=A0ACC3KC61_EUCGR|nr:hypothetical protein EUGRSUZ_F00702 [Eucalyptus grandis]